MRLLVIALVLSAACKADAPSGSGSASAPAPTPAATPAAPATPPPATQPAADAPAPRLATFARERRLRDLRQKLDTNGDGKLSLEELAASPYKNYDPATVDADHDGDISVDELDAVVGRPTRRR
jgi:EF hand domain-containing protein